MRTVRKLGDGIVVHGLELIGYSSRFSVWFDKDGNPYDAERFDRRGKNYNCQYNESMLARFKKAYPYLKTLAY